MPETSSLLADALNTIKAFESGKTRALTKKHGIFYTPLPIVRKMAEDALAPFCNKAGLDELMSVRILDPACGAGVFLLVCYELLIYRLIQLNANTPKNRLLLLKNSIYGIDIDQAALSVCNRLLLAHCFKGEVREADELKCNLICGNSLFDCSELDGSCENAEDNLIAVNYKQEFPRCFADEVSNPGFDVIIGNPPYGLARDNQLHISENNLLKKLFAEYRSGKVNKYMLFIAKASQLLAGGGTLNFIVPNSWLGISTARALRAKLFENGEFQEIGFFDRPAFPALDVETIVFRYRKTLRKEEMAIRLCHFEDAEQFRIREEYRLPAERCNVQNEYAVPDRWDSEIDSFFLKVSSASFPMSAAESPFISLIALQAYAEGKGTPPQSKETVKNHIFHHNAPLSESFIPYLEGRDICRYFHKWSGRYLEYGPHLAEPQSLERFSGCRIAVREILNPLPYCLNAAYLEKPFLYNKSVLNILPKCKSDAESILALLAILNSGFAGFWIQLFGRKSQRKLFPKLVNQDLKNFPLPGDFTKYRGRLADIARKALSTGHSQVSAALQREIDLLVLESYRLGEQDLPQIR